jgi:hypothetical protein
MGAGTFIDRLNGKLASIFAVFAMFLATIGVYGLLSLIVADRTREIAIRAVCGAQTSDIFLSMTSRISRAIFVGILLGVAVGLLLGIAIRSLLYGVAPNDIPSLSVAVGLVVTVALGGALGPLLVPAESGVLLVTEFFRWDSSRFGTLRQHRTAEFDPLWLIPIWNVRCDAFENELADKVSHGICTNVGQAVV